MKRRFTRFLNYAREWIRSLQLPRAPVYWVVLLVFTLAQIVVAVALVADYPLPQHLLLTADSLKEGEPWRLLSSVLLLTPHIENVSPDSVYVHHLTGMTLFLLMGYLIVSSVSALESRLGGRRIAGLAATALLFQLFLAVSVFGGSSFSPIGPVVALSLAALLEHSRTRGMLRREAMIDAHVVALCFICLLVFISSAYEAAYQGLLGGIVSGCVCGAVAISVWRRLGLRPDHPEVDSTANLVTVDELEFASLSELRQEADSLLQRVSSNGIESLSEDERKRLRLVSQRLKQVHAHESR